MTVAAGDEDEADHQAEQQYAQVGNVEELREHFQALLLFRADTEWKGCCPLRTLRHLRYWSSCSTRGSARSLRHSMSREVLGRSDPSLDGSLLSLRADPARDRLSMGVPRTSTRYRCCESTGPA